MVTYKSVYARFKLHLGLLIPVEYTPVASDEQISEQARSSCNADAEATLNYRAQAHATRPGGHTRPPLAITIKKYNFTVIPFHIFHI